jgi:hypothetical protein
MFKKLASLFCCLAFLVPLADAQTQLDPDAQIKWTTPITTIGPKSRFYNGVAFADQFPGAPNACLQVRNAALYALTNTPAGRTAQVNATGLQGIQQCHTDMFGSLRAGGNTPVNLTVLFGAVHMQMSVGQTVTNSGLHLYGMGPYATRFEYTGSTPIAQGIFYINGTTARVEPFSGNGLIDFLLQGVFIYGEKSNAVDALQMVSTHRSKLEDVYTWGVKGCGLHTLGAVTDTFIRPATSVADAAYIGIQGGPYNTPAHGLCFDGFGGNWTTDGTVIDARAEGLSGVGWNLIAANSMTFTAGTSESNGAGIAITSRSHWNTFISPDIEANSGNFTGVDTNDQGMSTVYINPIFDSPCSGRCTHSAIAGGGGGQYIIGESGANTTWTGSFRILGTDSDFGQGAGAGKTAADELQSNKLQVIKEILNNQGLQSISVAGCTITQGAIGNRCSNTIKLPVAESSTRYHVVCSANNGKGPWTVGNTTSITDTGFTVDSIALSASAAGGGLVSCIVTVTP